MRSGRTVWVAATPSSSLGNGRPQHVRGADEAGDERRGRVVVDLARASPACSMRPLLNTAMRLLIDSASSWSWVTNTNVMPTSRWIVLSSTCISSRSLRSSAPSGSSSSSTLGRLTRARARATRWRWPPRQLVGLAVGEARRGGPARASRRPGGGARPGRRRLTLSPYSTLSLHRHVGEQRVVLEDGVDVAVVGRRPGDVGAVEQHGAGGRAVRSRRSSAAPWSCRCPTGRAGRRTRRCRSTGRRRRPRRRRRTASSARRAGWLALPGCSRSGRSWPGESYDSRCLWSTARS